MDFFTHALLPYLLASYLAWEKRWVAALVLGGIAPDLDVFLSWAGSILPPHLLLVHRGITHSIFFGLLFGLLVLYLAALPRVRGLWRRDDLDLEFSARSLVLVWAGVALHLLLDYTTTRGVPLFYPWQSLRYSADLFFQIEPAVLAATILILAAMLRSWPTIQQKENLFVVFLLFLLLVGGIRMEGRWAAEEDFALGNASIYPLPGLFSWAALEEKGNSYLVSRYDLIAGTASFSPAIPKLKLASSQKEAEEALAAAEGLPQVKIFRWRSYAVAVNASFCGRGSWDIEYCDPMVLSQREGSWRFLQPPSSRYGSLRVAVQNGVARVVE